MGSGSGGGGMNRFIGVSVSIGRRFEWIAGNMRMIHNDICPTIRSNDYKLPHNVWIEYEDDTD